jgi:hypothetical protein
LSLPHGCRLDKNALAFVPFSGAAEAHNDDLSIAELGRPSGQLGVAARKGITVTGNYGDRLSIADSFEHWLLYLVIAMMWGHAVGSRHVLAQFALVTIRKESRSRRL